jgi:hypothetical protein
MIFRASSAVGEPVVLRKGRIKAGAGTIQAKKKEVMRAVTLIAAALALAGCALGEAQNDMRASRAALDAFIARIRVPDRHECDQLMQR